MKPILSSIHIEEYNILQFTRLLVIWEDKTGIILISIENDKSE